MANNNWQGCPLLRQILEQVVRDLDNAIDTCEMPAEARSKVEDFRGFVEAVLRGEGDRA